MNTLLIFFAIPLATIILSAILETFINSPIKIAGIFFSIFIVVAFALGGSAELILAALVYTIISFITALITSFIINNICTNHYVDNYNTGETIPNYNVDDNLLESAETTNSLEENNNLRCKKYR